MSILPEHVQAAVDALAPFRPQSAEQARELLAFWGRRDELGDAETDLAAWAAVDSAASTKLPGYARGYADGAAKRMREEHAERGRAGEPSDARERERLLNCPTWCVRDHTNDLRTPTDNLVSHEAEPLTPGVYIARTDCPAENRTGVPSLVVFVDVELATWEDAGRLARTILDGADQLHGLS